MQKPGTPYVLEVNARIPPRLIRLQELANNLWYSWDRTTRELFSRLDFQLWNAVGHSPKLLLKSIDEQHLLDAAENPAFVGQFNRVLSAFDSYLDEPLRRDGSVQTDQTGLVAYFCAEFGFHESLPIYSGGLGILAGDHTKTASDLRLPFAGVGLLYRQGYFHQTVDSEGNQQAEYINSTFEDLPIQPIRKEDGAEMHVQLRLPGRTIEIKVWEARIGHVRLYLLDTDLPCNSANDRDIAHRLYGGDGTTRIEQELVLGVGGVRALAALGLKPAVWHVNEGHAAFLVLERMRLLMREGLDFDAALEAVASNTVFTTHTAVPAGHDHFAAEMISAHFADWCQELGVDAQRLLELGRMPNDGNFNMTALAVRGSRHQNGVSRIHRGVSESILKDLWPQVPAEENPVSYVTNGVHVPTFIAPEWMNIFERFVGFEWSHRLDNPELARAIEGMPDHIFWSTRQHLKSQMLHLVRFRIRQQHARNLGGESQLDRLLGLADPGNPNVLTIGFGRRFATYKRATLLFENLDRLREIITREERPVLLVFAGKAHPADVPGQELIRRVSAVAAMPEFEGRILLVEDYDLRLARRLVTGVDVWLNNPVYPLEACGTSGMKAGINGVINLSVLDGWWGEGYQGDNGWAIKPASKVLEQHRRDAEEARTLYEILQDQVVPLYYRRGDGGFPADWIRIAKRSMASVMSQFNSMRMLQDYIANCYRPASEQGRRYAENGYRVAREVATWKTRVRAAWPGVVARRLDTAPGRIDFGDRLRIGVAVKLNGLAPGDIAVDLLFWASGSVSGAPPLDLRLNPVGPLPGDGEHEYALDFKPELCGKIELRLRLYPFHERLTHRFELGLILWV